jgi:hypothetical protein
LSPSPIEGKVSRPDSTRLSGVQIERVNVMAATLRPHAAVRKTILVPVTPIGRIWTWPESGVDQMDSS